MMDYWSAVRGQEQISIPGKSAFAFHCDKNYRLFVTVVRFEGIGVVYGTTVAVFLQKFMAKVSAVS